MHKGISVIIACFAVGSIVWLSSANSLIVKNNIPNLSSNPENNNGIVRVGKRNTIQDKARKLAKAGHFEQALILYEKAIQPEYINQAHEKSTAIGAMREIYKRQQNYDKALEMVDWFFRDGKSTPKAVEERNEIESLIQYRDSGSPKSIYDHIAMLRAEYAEMLPPNGYLSYSPIVISDILRLYDTIGDHDAGIKFIDEILEYGFSQNKSYTRVNTVAEAIAHGYKTAAEYLKVREAFKKDKAATATKRGGQAVTKGSATKALIQSDYFPW